jgi:hypothetical protein
MIYLSIFVRTSTDGERRGARRDAVPRAAFRRYVYNLARQEAQDRINSSENPSSISHPRTQLHFIQHNKGNSSCLRFSRRQRRPSLCPLVSPLWAPLQRPPPAITPSTTPATRVRRLGQRRIPGRQNGLALDSAGAAPIGTTTRVRPTIDRYVAHPPAAPNRLAAQRVHERPLRSAVARSHARRQWPGRHSDDHMNV